MRLLEDLSGIKRWHESELMYMSLESGTISGTIYFSLKTKYLHILGPENYPPDPIPWEFTAQFRGQASSF